MNNDYYLNTIPKSKEEAIHMDKLAEMWHTTERGVRSIIADLRNEGNLIVTDDNGYYVSYDTADLLAFYKKSRAKAMGIFKNVSNIRKVLKEQGAL